MQNLVAWVRKHLLISTLVVVALIGLAVALTPPKEEAQKETKTKQATGNLKLVVSQDDSGLTFTNNEGTTLKNCKVSINETYETDATLLVGKTSIAYSDITTEEGEKFNPLTHTIKDVFVSECDGQAGRSVLLGRE